MVLRYKMTHPPISCEKSFESSCWRVGTFSYSILAFYRARQGGDLAGLHELEAKVKASLEHLKK